VHYRAGVTPDNIGQPGPIGITMKTFILTKEIRAMRMKKLRDNKSLRDDGQFR
jgi:hypothetical protein